MTYSGIVGINYQLASNHLASGGEGDIYNVHGGTPQKVAKIYHTDKLSQELENKLLYMVKNPPDPSVLSQVAWPLDVLYDSTKKFCGFVMLELSINAELKDIYQYPCTVGLSSSNKVTIAQNICAVISAVHNAEYVFGDFNPRNIGVDKGTGRVAFLDTDSYHVFDVAKNKHYRCKVCADGYAAPELLEACSNHAASYPNDSKQLYEKVPLPTFTRETDNFALAIHIFKLLMNGYTPYGGIIEKITPSQASPSMGNAAIRRNEYSFRPGYKPLSPAVPPLDIFPQEIADLFTQAFLVIGSITPSQRPTSIEWYQALSRYETTMVDCSKNNLHQYDRKNKTCPFCEADVRYQSSINGNKVQAFTSPPPVTLPQQRTYSQPKKGACSQSKSTSGSSGGRLGYSTCQAPPNNWWQRLSTVTKMVLIALSVSVLVLGFSVLSGRLEENNNMPIVVPPVAQQPVAPLQMAEAQPAALEQPILRPLRISIGVTGAGQGSAHSVVIGADGSLWAWGNNSGGTLGDGTTTHRHTPVRIGSDTNWASISASSTHTTAIRTDGSLWTWGWNTGGQLGDGTSGWANNRHTPVQIGTDTNWVSVSAGSSHTVAIRTDGSLWAWGRNVSGQLGNGTVTGWDIPNPDPVRIGTGTNWASVIAGSLHTVALRTDGSLWAWGEFSIWHYW